MAEREKFSTAERTPQKAAKESLKKVESNSEIQTPKSKKSRVKQLKETKIKTEKEELKKTVQAKNNDKPKSENIPELFQRSEKSTPIVAAFQKLFKKPKSLDPINPEQKNISEPKAERVESKKEIRDDKKPPKSKNLPIEKQQAIESGNKKALDDQPVANLVQKSKPDKKVVIRNKSTEKIMPKVTNNETQNGNVGEKTIRKPPSRKSKENLSPAKESGDVDPVGKSFLTGKDPLPAIEKKKGKSESQPDVVSDPEGVKKMSLKKHVVVSSQESSPTRTKPPLERKPSKSVSREKNFKSIDDDFDLLEGPKLKVEEKRNVGKLKSHSESNLFKKSPMRVKKLSANAMEIKGESLF